MGAGVGGPLAGEPPVAHEAPAQGALAGGGGVGGSYDLVDAWLDAAWSQFGRPRVVSRRVISPSHLVEPGRMSGMARAIVAATGQQGCFWWWQTIASSSPRGMARLEVWIFGEGR